MKKIYHLWDLLTIYAEIFIIIFLPALSVLFLFLGRGGKIIGYFLLIISIIKVTNLVWIKECYDREKKK